MSKKRTTPASVLSESSKLEQFRSSLGETAKDYNAAQLQQLHQQMQQMAELLLDVFLAKRERAGRPHPTGFDTKSTED